MAEETETQEPVKQDEAEVQAAETTPEAETTETETPDPQEALARQGGWVPQDDWIGQGKDPALWRDAQIFNERGEFMRKISNLSKRVKSQDETLSQLAEHHKKVAEFERNKVLNELKKQKVDALRDDNHERVVEIDDEINDLKAMQIPDVQVNVNDARAELEESAKAWVGRNQWYEHDQDLRAQANIFMAGYRANNPQATPERIFEFAETQIRKSNPDKFRPKGGASPVASSERTTHARSKTGKAYPKLSEIDFEYQKIARNFEALGVMKADAYIKELVDTGVI